MSWFNENILIMKKILLSLVLCLCILQSKSESIYTYGEIVDFQSGFIGSLWHPFMRLSKYNSNDENNVEMILLTVMMKSSDTHYIYPEGNSKLLLKFDDGTIVEMISFDEVIKDHTSKYIANSLVNIYFTGRHYIITDECKQKLLSQPIVKVRIELGNGVRKDFNVSEKHGKKVLKKLQKSYASIEKVQQERLDNANGDLKSDF